MFRCILFFLLFITSCAQVSRQEKIQRAVTGDWLVIWGQHRLQDEEQYQVYGKIQDSIIEAKSLKLVRFFDDGSFLQMDTPEQSGKWQVSRAGEVVIGDGGQGFDNLKTNFLRFKQNELELEEQLNMNGDVILLNWHLKKIKNSSLFERERNLWRNRPTRAETEQEIRNRLAIIFIYYSDYFKLVAKESSYFIGRRVPLPLKFYQHAMGTLDFDPRSNFANLFFNEEQARLAHGWVKRTVYRLGNKFPDGKNYVEEYADYMKLVAKEFN
jgi:hypothetical protein